MWISFCKKEKIIRIPFRRVCFVRGCVPPTPLTKRRATPPGLPGLFSPGLWPGSPLPAFGRVNFGSEGGRTRHVRPPRRLQSLPGLPGLAIARRGSDKLCPTPPGQPVAGRVGPGFAGAAFFLFSPALPGLLGKNWKKHAKIRNAKNTRTQEVREGGSVFICFIFIFFTKIS